MSRVGIFYSFSGDVSQPSYRGNLVDVIQKCIDSHNKNILYLKKAGHQVCVYVLINYQTQLISNIEDVIKNGFVEENVQLSIITYDELKKEFFELIGIENTENFCKFYRYNDNLWIQSFQYFREASKNLLCDYFIKSRLDTILLNEKSFVNLVNHFGYAKNRFHLENITKGYFITTEIFLNSTSNPIDVRDTLFCSDKNCIIKCSEDYKLWIDLPYICSRGNLFFENNYYAEEILGFILVKNNIGVFTIDRDQNGIFLWREVNGKNK